MAALWRVRRLGEVTSTNDVVKQAIDLGEPEGFAVRARSQTGGYGRQGRKWASPEGGLYASWLVRPAVPRYALPLFSLVAGLALRHACASFLEGCEQERIRVKWPNDVVVWPQGARDGGEALGMRSPLAARDACAVHDAREACDVRKTGAYSCRAFQKLCGISVEARGGALCVGTGVNVFRPACSESEGSETQAAPTSKNVPVYLADLALGLAALSPDEALDAVFDAVARALEDYYRRWLAQGFATDDPDGPFVSLEDEFNGFSALTCVPLSIRDATEGLIAEGTALRVDGLGRLVLRRDDGALRAVPSGEAHVRLT